MTVEVIRSVLPDVSAVSAKVQDAWRPEIKDPNLRSELLNSVDLSDGILADILRTNGFEATDDEPSLIDPKTLSYFMVCDLERLMRRAGLVTHGHQLAQLVCSKTVDGAKILQDFDDLRFALSLRDKSIGDEVDPAHFAEAVETSGTLCFAAWLGDLPSDVQSAIALSQRSEPALSTSYVRSAAHADIFETCLLRMRDEA